MSSISAHGQTPRTGAPSATGTTPKSILARLDRISVRSMPFIFIGIIGTGFLFAFYDVFDINVSFICSSPAWARCTTRSPPDYTQFVLARVSTGIGVGADLAIVNTYVGEVAPRRNRARWISVIFIMSSVGAVLGIWLGLFLTTSPAPWPHGLSFAQAGPSFTDGWRWIYGVGALLAAIGVLLRLELPESARWLVGQGRLDEVDKVVSDMELVASKHGPLPPVPDVVPIDQTTPESSHAFGALFRDRAYTPRVIQPLAVWFLAYVTVFGFSAGFTSMLVSLNWPPEAGLITAIGAFGFLACALFAVAFADRIERKLWLPIGAVITVVGGVIVAEAGTTSLAIAFVGAAIVFFGFNIWVPMTYTLSTESFPTRARVTGFGLVDGVGPLGGGIGVLVIAPQFPNMAVLEAMLVVSGFLVAAAIVAQVSPSTRGRYYEEISP